MLLFSPLKQKQNKKIAIRLNNLIHKDIKNEISTHCIFCKIDPLVQ